MKRFWELFEQSVIVQAVVTAALIITLCVMFIMGREVPDQLLQLTYIVVGFWFGSKVGYRQGIETTKGLMKRRLGDGND